MSVSLLQKYSHFPYNTILLKLLRYLVQTKSPVWQFFTATPGVRGVGGGIGGKGVQEEKRRGGEEERGGVEVEESDPRKSNNCANLYPGIIYNNLPTSNR